MDRVERWKDIPGFEGMYQVSDLGRARRMAYMSSRKGAPYQFSQRDLQPNRASKLGYPQLHLWKNRRRSLKYVHTAVLEAFVGPRPTSAHQVCHHDGDVTNNCLFNLRWGTRDDNFGDVVRHGSQKGTRNPGAKLTESNIRTIRARRAGGESVYVISLDYGISSDYVYQIASRKAWAHVA